MKKLRVRMVVSRILPALACGWVLALIVVSGCSGRQEAEPEAEKPAGPAAGKQTKAEKKKATGSGGRKVGNYTIVGPFIHKNLGIFLIKGKETLPPDAEFVTLDEAIQQKILVVHETGNVSKLAVENVSKNKTVFIQAGDIVKGGKQDRVLSVDLIVKANSGKLPIASFCVERGRWSGRGVEDRAKFAVGGRATGKKMRLAMRSKTDQGEVWKEVAANQGKLSKTLKVVVTDARSASSFQLSLENKELKSTSKEYIDKLKAIVDKHPDAIGYAFTVNGGFSSADIYGSRKLFSKLWPRMLEACAVEAIADYDKKAEGKKPDESWVNGLFVDGHVEAKIKSMKKRQVSKRLNYNVSERAKVIGYDTIDAEAGLIYHKSYDAKE